MVLGQWRDAPLLKNLPGFVAAEKALLPSRSTKQRNAHSNSGYDQKYNAVSGGRKYS
jgi:hypothetical protein